MQSAIIIRMIVALVVSFISLHGTRDENNHVFPPHHTLRTPSIIFTTEEKFFVNVSQGSDP